MTERDEKGRFKCQGPNRFDEEEAKEMGEEHGSNAAWEKHRQEIMEEFDINYE
jgi:hypothetical protein